MITAIVAHGARREIGRGNQLLRHLSGDLKRFKDLTSGHPIIMGRKTWESLPRKPLPHRTNLVVTGGNRDRVLAEGAQMACGLHEAIEFARQQSAAGNEVFVIGGGEIYRHFLAHCGKLLVSRMNESFPDADTFFPEYSAQFALAESIPCADHTFETWLRQKQIAP
ncbi:dihydrofolate reductase [Oscillatoria laete-virens NRMC-F 0139]|nr:dihydrofolate reductase [Oscillatoria laete-virens]MDL5053088.1 dihydrofolate reductase [Oscillatoria laete-virens NRMC-F 0139]